MNSARRTAVLGGTGPFGRGLAWRLAGGGAEVVIGSRRAARAEETAAGLRRKGPPPPLYGERPLAAKDRRRISGARNREAAEQGDPVFLAVPYLAQERLLRELGPLLDRKLIVACGVIWPPGSHPETSAAEEAERVLRKAGAQNARIAAAFQTVAAGVLRGHRAAPADPPDVLVFADRKEDRRAAAAAAGLTGLRAVSAGPLSGSRIAEAALGVLLELNRSGAARHAGLRLTGMRPRAR